MKNEQPEKSTLRHLYEVSRMSYTELAKASGMPRTRVIKSINSPNADAIRTRSERLLSLYKLLEKKTKDVESQIL